MGFDPHVVALALAVPAGVLGYLYAIYWVRWTGMAAAGSEPRVRIAFFAVAFAGVFAAVDGHLPSAWGPITAGLCALFFGLTLWSLAALLAIRGFRRLRGSTLGRIGERDFASMTIFVGSTLVCLAGGIAIILEVGPTQSGSTLFDKSPICSSEVHADCRLQRPAIVTAVRPGSETQYVSVRFGDRSRQEFQAARFDLWQKLYVGEQVTLEYWHGTAAEIESPAGEIDTPDSPHQRVAAVTGVGIGDGVAVVLFGSFAALYGSKWLMATRSAHSATGAASMTYGQASGRS